MCSGAMLHARLARLVFGASDTKAGMAGSRADLFGMPDINPHTQVQGGLLADECGERLKRFFQARRVNTAPVPEAGLRPSDAAFADLADMRFAPRYVADLAAAPGWRLHFVDEGPADAPLSWLCLHGDSGWSYTFRHAMPVWLAAGHRVAAPDMLGFGRSDKPKKAAFHQWHLHKRVLLEWIERQALDRLVLVLPGSAAVLGLGLLSELTERLAGLVLINAPDDPLSPAWCEATLRWQQWCQRHPLHQASAVLAEGGSGLSDAERLAYQAPFPDRGHSAALQAYAGLLPTGTDSDSAADVQRGWALFQQHWRTRTVAFHSRPHPHWHANAAPWASGAVTHALPDAPHVLPDNGPQWAEQALAFFQP